jgi:XapX domain-containing protein
MSIVIKALITGIVCGAVFSALKLPIPAPPALAGIAGIIGIYLGYLLISNIPQLIKL